MSKIIKKIMNANQEYAIIGGAGGSEQVTTMPTPSAENLGTIVQYVGDTNQYYTNGYFYKVVSNGEVPPTYSREQVDTQPASSEAEDVSYDNTTSGMTADNVQEALDEVFQSVSNGKELLADAITDKGVQTSASDSFSTMATNISNISWLNSLITQSWLWLWSSDLARCEWIWGTYTGSLSYCNVEVDWVLYSIWTIWEYDYTSDDWTNKPATYVATIIDWDTIKQFKWTGTVPTSDTNRWHGYYSHWTTYYQDGNKIYLSFGTTVAYNTSWYDTLVSLWYFDTTTKEFTQNITTLYRVPYWTAHPDNEKTSTLTKYRIGYTVQEKAFHWTWSWAQNAAVLYPRIYKVS